MANPAVVGGTSVVSPYPTWPDVADFATHMADLSTWRQTAPPTADTSAMGATFAGGWYGGALGPDGNIYCVPNGATTILIINPVAGTASTSKLGATIGGGNKWSGAVLAPNNKIYCAPRDATTVLVIDVDAQSATTTNFGLDLSGSAKYVGGCYDPVSERVIFSCRGTTSFLVIDPSNDTASFNAYGMTIPATSRSWDGQVPAAGKVFGVPLAAVKSDIINTTGTSRLENFGLSFGGTADFVSPMLAPDGHVYGVPYDATTILQIDPVGETATKNAMGATLTGTNKWYGGAVGDDGIIYCMPGTTSEILMIDGVGQTATRSALGATIPDGSGGIPWASAIAAPNGVIYGIPASASTILRITTHGTGGGTDQRLAPYDNKF